HALPSSTSAPPDDAKIHRGQQGFDRRQLELSLPFEEFVNGCLGERGIVRPRQLPKAINTEMEMLHLPRHCLPDDALGGWKPGARIALQRLKLPPLGNFA